MPSRTTRRVPRCPALVLLLLTLAGPALGGSAVQSDRVIAGGPKDSLEVRHLVLRGSNVEIGRALAELARERYGVRLERARDPLQVRAERRFLERNAPILLDRMRGVAEAFGRDFEDLAWDYSQLGFTDLRAGCSIAHLPREATA